jgi:hypothetical protein
MLGRESRVVARLERLAALATSPCAHRALSASFTDDSARWASAAGTSTCSARWRRCGGASLSARLRLADRWMRRSTKEQWIFSARAFPRTFGEGNQERAIWGIVAWATSQAKVRAVIVDGAGDYEAVVGLRAPGGRLRPAPPWPAPERIRPRPKDDRAP